MCPHAFTFKGAENAFVEQLSYRFHMQSSGLLVHGPCQSSLEGKPVELSSGIPYNHPAHTYVHLMRGIYSNSLSTSTTLSPNSAVVALPPRSAVRRP